MEKCSECGKKLRFFEGHIHPLRGKQYLVCSACFDYIIKSIAFYNICLFKGRENHKKECYFWDKEKKRCRNEEYFKKGTRRKKVTKINDKKEEKNVIKNPHTSRTNEGRGH
ncbi:hypothetical protein AYK25_09570 [Thermoplasmatales archaeon SM1-50]|nr:MAG: hypothetical protein AYK25_09570 [Thermoplasmatales archaeon SM1-50]